MKKDGYADQFFNGEWVGGIDHYQQNTLITIEGYHFHKNGGYANQKVKERAKKIRSNTHLWILTIGAGLAGVYSLIQIATDIFGSKKEIVSKYIVLPPAGSQTNETQLKTTPYPDTTSKIQKTKN